MNYKPNHKYKDFNKAQKMKKERLYLRILSMLKCNDSIFLTFTFSNKCLNKTTEKTRLRNIKKYLNDFALEYILNVDYGNKTKREHYHAIARPRYRIFLLDYFKDGILQAEKIDFFNKFKNINKSLEDIANRLTEHATKYTTLNNRIIYSRKMPLYKVGFKYINEVKERQQLIRLKKQLKRINLSNIDNMTDEEYIKNGYIYDDTLEEWVKYESVD